MFVRFGIVVGISLDFRFVFDLLWILDFLLDLRLRVGFRVCVGFLIFVGFSSDVRWIIDFHDLAFGFTFDFRLMLVFA